MVEGHCQACGAPFVAPDQDALAILFGDHQEAEHEGDTATFAITVAQDAGEAKAIASATAIEATPLTAGVIGWPCKQLAGVTCVHDGCMPASAIAAVAPSRIGP